MELEFVRAKWNWFLSKWLFPSLYPSYYYLLLLTGTAPAFGEGKNLKRFPDSAKLNYLKVDLSLLDETKPNHHAL